MMYLITSYYSIVIFNTFVFYVFKLRFMYYHYNIRESGFDYIFTLTSKFYTFICFYNINYYYFILV